MTPNLSRIPTKLPDVSYEDLTGLVTQEITAHPAYSGGYADVHIGHYRKDPNTEIKVAIKVLRLAKDADIQKIKIHLIRETVVWTQLCHPNILDFLGLADDLGRCDCPALISPFVEDGLVMDYLVDHPQPEVRMVMMAGVAQGLSYLHNHQKQIIHGDLKPSNILVSDDGRPLLCDFGRSRIMLQRGFTTRTLGTVRYQAPELLSAETPVHDKAADVYAFANTCSEIWTGKKPYEDILNDTATIIPVIGGRRPACPSPADTITKALWEQFKKCWKEEPKKRVSIDEVVQFFESMSDPRR